MHAYMHTYSEKSRVQYNNHEEIYMHGLNKDNKKRTHYVLLKTNQFSMQIFIRDSYLLLELKTRLGGGLPRPYCDRDSRAPANQTRMLESCSHNGRGLECQKDSEVLKRFGNGEGIKDSMSSAVAIWLMCCFKIIYLLGFHDSSQANHLIPQCVRNKNISPNTWPFQEQPCRFYDKIFRCWFTVHPLECFHI